MDQSRNGEASHERTTNILQKQQEYEKPATVACQGHEEMSQDAHMPEEERQLLQAAITVLPKTRQMTSIQSYTEIVRKGNEQ